MTKGLAGMPEMIEELRGALVSAAREGLLGSESGEPLLNIGFLLGSCMNVAPEGYSMTLFNRLHRLHGELVAMEAPAPVLESLQRIYTKALELQVGSLKEAGKV